jgi:hypothetical protein
VDEPDLTAGPVTGYRDRVLAVGAGTAGRKGFGGGRGTERGAELM